MDALQKQVIEAEACVRDNNWLLVDRYIELKSGTTSRGRAQYCRLLEDIPSDKFDIIVIKTQDRLMRNTKDWYLFLDQMQKNGKRLYLYLERKFYTSEDSLITGIKAILAEEYSRELSKKITNAHRHRQQNGGRIMLTGKAYGYQKLPDGGVSIVESEAEIIRQIYWYCATGYGSRTIANILQEQGVRSKNGKFMNAATIRRIIRNSMYKGVFVMNRQHFDFETKRVYRNPPEEWIYRKGVVPAIVDDELWQRANDAMSCRAADSHRDGSYGKGSNPGKYELSGKLICGACGNPYYRIWRRGYADPEQTVIEWKCSSYINYGRKTGRRNSVKKVVTDGQEKQGCDNPHLEETVICSLLEQVCDRYFEMVKLDRKNIIQKTMRLLKKAMRQSESGKAMEKLDEEEKRYDSQKELLLSKLLDGVISDADYQRKNCDLEKRLEDVRDRKREWNQKKQEMEVLENRMAEIQNRLEHGGLEKATVGRMVQDIDRIVVHEWYLELEYDPLKLTGLTKEQPLAGALLEEGEVHRASIRIPYLFSAQTRRGRILNEIRILELLQEAPGATASQLAEKLDISVGMVRTRIRKLKEDGYLCYVGGGGHGVWKIVKPIDELRRQVKI